MDRKHHDSASDGSGGYGSLMRRIQRHKEIIFEHRPRTLSIAVNGRITAFHDVQGERCTLCSRIEHADSAQFVEVFSEQQVRLALLPVGQPPPDGLHSQTQRVALSDQRWLQLTLSFDGLGLHSEVTYVDPALAAAASSEEIEDSPLTTATRQDTPTTPSFTTAENASFLAPIRRLIESIRPAVPAWFALLVLVLAIGGYFAYEGIKSPSNPHELLSQSMRLESAELNGQAEHQVLRVEETGPDGRILLQGTVDVWKDSKTGRHVRRLYDANRRLIAAEWQSTNGKSGSYAAPLAASLPNQEREFAASALWHQDVSANAFQAIADRTLTMHKVGGNYEISSAAPHDELHIVSATLVLNGQLHVVGEILRTQKGSRPNVVRFVQADYELRPASSVSDSVFDAPDLETHSRLEHTPAGSSGALGKTRLFDSNRRTVQLQIAVLAQLNKLGADVGEPIEVNRTQDGRVRISGAAADGARKRAIEAALASLPDSGLLDIRLISQRDTGNAPKSTRLPKAEPANVYDIENTQAPADALIRGLFSSKGWNVDRVNSSSKQFSRDALGHAQRAMQEAYALDRLGGSFSARDLKAVDNTSRHQWAEMSALHASALQRELRALHEQLDQLAPPDTRASDAGNIVGLIQSPEEFAHSAHVLLRQVQRLNESVGLAFASGSGRHPTLNVVALVNEAVRSIPLRDAGEVDTFTSRLAAATDRKTTAQSTDKRTPIQDSPK